jgi:hypothetical protein
MIKKEFVFSQLSFFPANVLLRSNSTRPLKNTLYCDSSFKLRGWGYLGNDSLLATPCLPIHSRVLDRRRSDLLFLFLVFILVVLALVSGGRDPQAGFTVVQGCVLAREIMALSVSLDVVAAALRQSASTG